MEDYKYIDSIQLLLLPSKRFYVAMWHIIEVRFTVKALQTKGGGGIKLIKSLQCE